MNTNRSGVKENAFANIDNEKFNQNFDHIFNREKCQCEECEKEKKEFLDDALEDYRQRTIGD